MAALLMLGLFWFVLLVETVAAAVRGQKFAQSVAVLILMLAAMCITWICLTFTPLRGLLPS